MSAPLTIVMYHYVRNLEQTRYPGIKGLTVQQFKNQIEYLARYYTFVSFDQVMASLDSGEAELPRNSVLLTFDDGYIDHFINVFPILDQKGIDACFFPSAKAIVDRCVLDVNKIQFVLASASDNRAVVNEIFFMLDELRTEFGLDSNKTYFQTYGVANRYDSAELQFIKRVLQTGLPEKCRTEVTGRLFRKYVTEDEASFATELYMTPDQLMCLKRNGMSIGSHGYNHVWMDTLTPATQETEIDSSLEFLGNMGSDLNRWSFNYPYGAYNESLVSLLKSKGCGFGLTTKVGIADLDADDSLTLPRLDTNDLPKDLDAGPNEWTMRVIV